jgi:hypothetical protein
MGLPFAPLISVKQFWNQRRIASGAHLEDHATRVREDDREFLVDGLDVIITVRRECFDCYTPGTMLQSFSTRFAIPHILAPLIARPAAWPAGHFDPAVSTFSSSPFGSIRERTEELSKWA